MSAERPECKKGTGSGPVPSSPSGALFFQESFTRFMAYV